MTYTTYEQFHQHLKKRKDFQHLAELLQNIINAPVTIYIRSLDKRIDVPNSDLNDLEMNQIMRCCSVNGDMIQQIKEKDRRFTVRWIYSSRSIVGGIFLWGVHSPLQTWEQVALEQTAVITELEIERKKAIFATFQRFRNEFLTNLLNGVYDSREALYRRAKEVNWNLEEHYRVVLLDQQLDKVESRDDHSSVWEQKNTILTLIEKEVARVLPKSLTGLDSKNRIAILIPDDINSHDLITKLNDAV